MELEKQCCTVEQAKELIRLGVNVETCFEWVRFESDCFDADLDDWAEPILMSREAREACEAHIVFHYSAPTVAELGVILPWRGVHYEFIVTQESNYLVHRLKIWTPGSPVVDLTYIEKMNEAEARADALIWLIRNKYIDPKGITL
jgi:hypothetical protein